ncbi:MAG: hypothetical protein ACOWWM_12575 [Desulfobacterales bacterium]
MVKYRFVMKTHDPRHFLLEWDLFHREHTPKEVRDQIKVCWCVAPGDEDGRMPIFVAKGEAIVPDHLVDGERIEQNLKRFREMGLGEARVSIEPA